MQNKDVKLKNISSGTVHAVPKDAYNVLYSDTSILERWNDITPLVRNELIYWIETVKHVKTRQSHITR